MKSRPLVQLCLTLVSVIIIYTLIPDSRFKPTQSPLKFTPSPYKNLTQWPNIDRPPLDPVIEQKIADLISIMTLQEKIAQMTQGEIDLVTPDHIEEYQLGSIFNGGGHWPKKKPSATVNDWLEAADAYWLASQRSRLKIPPLWGTDAVHGHNNVSDATMFPHNLALGATGNIELINEIAQTTARQVIATGLDWTFAPTVAVVQDPRWGRTYESFSQDEAWVYPMAKAAVQGFQSDNLSEGILATAKHFIGDGATLNGVDRGNVRRSENHLRNVQAQGFYAALEANVQTVMVSYSSWKGMRMHEHQYLISGVLKKQMGFDGFVVSDYNAIEEVYGCTRESCPQAVNAGIDMIMVPNRWRQFISQTVENVENGLIPIARIDDAVTRILRVKHRAGLFEKPMPSKRSGAGELQLLRSEAIEKLARRAVQESLVLLKNNNQVLPLKSDGHYLLLGDYDMVARQAGGWSINWQGGSMPEYLYKGATSIGDGLRQHIEAGGGQLDFDRAYDANEKELDAIILVMTERSYAEMFGDITSWKSMAAERQLGFRAIELLNELPEHLEGVPLVTVFVGGRPLWMNSQINRSDAFVMAWLPGSQAAGVADGLLGVSPIEGRLPINWPADDCARYPASARTALFPIGYGLTFADKIDIGTVRPTSPATTWGSNNLAPACVWQYNLTTPFH